MGSPRREKTLLAKLEDITTTKKAYFLLWKYKIKHKDMTFEEISKKFLGGISEDVANDYFLEEDVQSAIKCILRTLHTNKMIELYTIYFEKAKEDTQAFKAFIEFSEKFFNNGDEDELATLLNNITIGDDNE